MVTAGAAAVGVGRVWHRRNQPTVHEFDYRVNQIWIDPDRPGDLFDQHRLWSTRSPRPVRFKREDYYDSTTAAIGPAIRAKLAEPLGRTPTGPVRMLTQPRTWGWLFNPITVYLVWDQDRDLDADGDPVGAVLEVTNTPWNERTHYPLALAPTGDGKQLESTFEKQMHVSPFLDLDYRYHFTVSETEEPDQPGQQLGRSVTIGVDVVGPGDDAIVETRLQVHLAPASPSNLRSVLYRHPLSTHRVSLGIHWQAARLAAKRVPFIPHPGKRT
jgi:DUF1365 family protein